MLRPFGWSWMTDSVAAESTDDFWSNLAHRAIRAVEHDAQTGERPAGIRVDEVVAVLGNDCRVDRVGLG